MSTPIDDFVEERADLEVMRRAIEYISEAVKYDGDISVEEWNRTLGQKNKYYGRGAGPVFLAWLVNQYTERVRSFEDQTEKALSK